MVTIPLRVSDELAGQLIPLQDRLPEIIQLGLRHWREAEAVPLTPRQRVERLWASAGLTVLPDPAVARRYSMSRKRQPPVRVGGKPVSQIVIEQRRAR